MASIVKRTRTSQVRDKRTGETLWKTPRPDHRGWSTPILVQTAGRQELVLNGHDAVRGYDPVSGKELWSCRSFNGRGEPTVTPAGDLLCVVNGLSGDIYAVRPGGQRPVRAGSAAVQQDVLTRRHAGDGDRPAGCRLRLEAGVGRGGHRAHHPDRAVA